MIWFALFLICAIIAAVSFVVWLASGIVITVLTILTSLFR